VGQAIACRGAPFSLVNPFERFQPVPASEQADSSFASRPNSFFYFRNAATGILFLLDYTFRLV
jgi:hypothetical protein